MFGKKQKESTSDIKKTETSYSDNIFKELSGNLDFGKEEIIEEKIDKKDKEYYLKLTLSILGIINITLILLFISSYLYVMVQIDPTYENKTFLDPFCSLLLGDLEDKKTQSSCSSISALVKDYDKKTNNLKEDIVKKINSIALTLFEIENFKNSREVSFIVDNKINKLKVLDILNDFDRLKNDFSSGNKKLIECSGMTITSDSILKTECNVYSSYWEKANSTASEGIIGESGNMKDRIDGTSISTAASFLNFIEKNPAYNFQLIGKQKSFNSDLVLEGTSVRVTKVQLELKYNNLKNNLSF